MCKWWCSPGSEDLTVCVCVCPQSWSAVIQQLLQEIWRRMKKTTLIRASLSKNSRASALPPVSSSSVWLVSKNPAELTQLSSRTIVCGSRMNLWKSKPPPASGAPYAVGPPVPSMSPYEPTLPSSLLPRDSNRADRRLHRTEPSCDAVPLWTDESERRAEPPVKGDKLQAWTTFKQQLPEVLVFCAPLVKM